MMKQLVKFYIQPYCDNAGDGGNAVDAIHEIVKIGCADNEDRGGYDEQDLERNRLNFVEDAP